MSLKLSPEDKTALQTVAREEAAAFLATQLAAVDGAILRQCAALDGAPLPRGAAAMLEGYEQQKRLIEALSRESQRQPLIDVLRRRLRAAQRAIAELSAQTPRAAVPQPDLRQARTDEALLQELVRRWRAWLHRGPPAWTDGGDDDAEATPWATS